MVVLYLLELNSSIEQFSSWLIKTTTKTMVVSILVLLMITVGASTEKLNLRGKHCYQNGRFRGRKAELAVNGIGDCWNDGFSQTAWKHNPWWQVNLGSLYIIERVKVRPRYNTTMELYISKHSKDRSWDRQCGDRDHITGRSWGQFTCQSKEESIMVSIWRPRENDYTSLALCDVEIYATKKKVNCGPPRRISNAKSVYSSSSEGSQVSYSCNRGYRQNGATILTCTRWVDGGRTRGRWIARRRTPSCSIVSCDSPGHLHNGYYERVQRRYIYGNSVTYKCNKGHRMTGESRSRCTETGTWSNPTPTCHIISCETPQDPENGYHEQSRYTYDSYITYKCKRGHTISGEASSRCTATGQWSHPPPTCRPITCRDPESPLFGNRRGDSFLFDSVLEFSCDAGYRIQGPRSIECGLDGFWSDSIPQCQVITCGALAEPLNGHVINGSGHRVGSVRHYGCELGYSLHGNKTITCQEHNESGIWSDVIPKCEKKSCGHPGQLESGHMHGREFTFGSSVLYSCVRGYILKGPSRRTCLVSGWSGSEPKCNPIRCRDPGTPPNGHRSNGTIRFGSVVIYSCKAGYNLKGSITRTCGIDGLWSNRKPVCEAVKCNPIPIPTHGSKEGDVFEFPKTITFSCFPGYILEGSRNTSCQENGRWSNPQPNCKACEVGFYKESMNNHPCVRCPPRSTTVTTASSRKEHCSCSKGFSGPLGGPCKVVSCDQLASPKNGKISNCSTNMGSECVFTCNQGYIRSGGVARRVCTETGWTGNPVSCTACPKNMYTMFPDVVTCTSCPRDTQTEPGTVGKDLQSCLCKPGFLGPPGGPCGDLDECLVNPCNGTCVNTKGSFRCRCDIPGYILDKDQRNCIINETCSKLTEKPKHGMLSCSDNLERNSKICYIQCNPGYFFVSGINDYITCGDGTLFEWSHRLANITARIPACTREHFVDVDLPMMMIYYYNASCTDFSVEDVSDRLNKTVNSFKICHNHCDVHDVKVECTNRETGRSELKVGFKMMLRNPRPNMVPVNCTQRCKHENMRQILFSMHNLSLEVEILLKTKPVLFNSDVSMLPQNITHGRPVLLCEQGYVLTDNRLCVPCDRGHYLPSRNDEMCLPCPVGKYQDEQGQPRCKSCLEGSTTMGTGSNNPTMCSQRIVSVINDAPQRQ